MILYVYMLQNDQCNKGNSSIISHVIILCVCVVKTIEIYSLASFEYTIR